MAQFSEISEADAPDNIREICTDIRACLGAPMVNLVYRHMATIPGCLEWGWGTLRPLFASGMIPDAAAEITRNVNLPPMEPIPRAMLDAAVPNKPDQAAVVATLESYNRANPMNLIALEVLRLSMAHGPRGPVPASETQTPATAWKLPAMVDPASVDPVTAKQLDILARQGTGGPDGVVPSLYRHLAHWPDLLTLVTRSTEDLFERADFGGLCGALEIRATEAAGRLPRPDPGLPAPDKAQSDGIMALIGFFPTAICRMIVIGAWLRRNLPV
ncbi:MAG: hypothetical protein VX741_00700 [Pseudomonadota bacterium]|nr:hypothetical protein [Pseudomonadota bacterium]